ncbi:MAG: GH92 family glycosyl hydrolase [Polaribacter sp.]
MINFRYSFYVLSLSMLMVSCKSSSDKIVKKSQINSLNYVDPMIGTDGWGHTFPGATTPFGMVQLSPSHDDPGRNWVAGYHYTDTIIKGFAHNHLSGPGLGAFGDFLIMPTSGELIVNPGKDASEPDKTYRSRFSHDREDAKPGYYSVVLDDYNIKVELTASQRVGFHRYTFNNKGENHIIIDPTHSIRENIKNAEIEFISDTEIRGMKASTGAAGRPEPRTVFFYAKFSKPFKSRGLVVKDKILMDSNKATNKSTRAFISYDLEKGEQVDVKLALSYISYKGAKKNFDAEATGKDFDLTLKDTQDLWKEKLSKFEIKGTESQKRTFYTAVYHSFIGPNLISDVDGKYIVEFKELQSDIPQYSNLSTWDTYRALHPLFNLVEHKKNAEIVNSIASRFTDAKVSLPIWECGGYDNYCMIGRSPIAVLGEAILKNIDGINIDAAYDAMYDAAFTKVGASPNYGKNNGMDSYLENNGFITADIGCAVSKTTEYNYHDYVLAQVAKKLGKMDDYAYFSKRSKGYRNLWNKDKMYLWPRFSDGKWMELDLTEWGNKKTGLKSAYISGNIWAYSTYAPHDMDSLINLVGGKPKFVKWLDRIFTDTTAISGEKHTDISGFIGKLGFGDEPGHHTPYLYTYAGAPERTQELVRQIATDFFSDKPDGLVNNEDFGQMSAWYIFSSLGFYPVSPADKEYAIGSPLLDEAVVKLDNGKTLKVTAINNSSENKYVKSVSFNGEEIKDFIITHDMIMSGGNLVFQMDAK